MKIIQQLAAENKNLREIEEAICDAIDQWHEADTNQFLPEYLGMTDSEYAKFVTTPESILETLNKYRIK